VENIIFWVDFVDGKSNKLQTLGLEGTINWAFNVFTLPNFENFNFENVKNKKCVHILAKGTS
jgi:hypothetical protein